MFKFFVILQLIFCLVQTDAKAEPDFSSVQVVTSFYEPYSYLDDGLAQGVAVNQVRKIFAELNYFPDIKIYPWVRAYKKAVNTPNTLIFSIARTLEREELFHWVGEIVNFNVYLFKDKKRKDIQIDHLNQASPYRIGALHQDVKAQYLSKNGITTTPLTNEESGIKMVLNQRIDLLPTDIVSMKHRLKKLNLPSDALVPAYFLKEISRPLYIAMSKDTPTEIVEAFKAAYKRAFP